MNVNTIDKLRSCLATFKVLGAEVGTYTLRISMQEAEEIIKYCDELEKALDKACKDINAKTNWATYVSIEELKRRYLEDE